MAKSIKVQFVSDVSCPWCAIGFHSLLKAIERVGSEISVEIEIEPFELNPQMKEGGQNQKEHLIEKYGMSLEQLAQSRAMLKSRGEDVGFVFNQNDESRIYNTFDAHRVLLLARAKGKQAELKRLLFDAHFGENADPGNHDLLIQLSGKVGLDQNEVSEILKSDLYSDEVRAQEKFWTDRGVRSVPTVVFNNKHAVVGGQPPETFERILRELDSEGKPSLR